MSEHVVSIRLKAVVGQFAADMAAAQKSASDLVTKTANVARTNSQTITNIGKGMMLAGGLAVAAAGLATKAAIDWESAWTGVTKTVDATPAQLAKIEDGLRGLAKTLPESHDQIAAVAEAAGQLGVQADSIVDFTKVMVDLGETTNLSSDEAATSLAQLMNVMRTSPKDVDRLGSAVVALGNNGASTERDIVQMAQRIAGAGHVIGLSEADVLGWANALASVGIEAEAGGSAISKVMTDIAKSVQTGDAKLAIFAKTAGMSSAEFQKAFKDDPNDAIASFVEGLGRIDAAGGSVFQTLDDLGQSDVRVSRALLALSGSGDLLRKSLALGNQAWEDNNALTEEAEKRYKTTAAQIEIAKNNIHDAAIDFGEVFLPAVVAASEATSGFTQGVSDLPDDLKVVLSVGTLAGGAIALFGGAALVALPKIVALHDAIVAIRTDMPRTYTALGSVARFLVGPWGLALAAAGFVAYQFVDAAQKQRQAVDDLTDSLDQNTGAFTDNTRQQVIDQLRSQNVLGRAKDMGIALNDVTDAALGNSAALGRVRKATEEYSAGLKAAGADIDASAYKDVLYDIQAQQGALAAARKKWEENAEAMGDASDAGRKVSATTTEKQIPSLEDLARVADGATTAVEGLSDEVRNFGKTTFDAIGAELSFRQAVDDAAASVGDEGFTATLDKNTQAGRDNWAALLQVASGAEEYAAAAYDSTGSTDDLNAKLLEGRDALIAQAIKFGASREEAEKYADQLLATPEVVKTRVEADVSPARRAFEGLLSDYQNRTVSLRAVMEYADRLGPGDENGGLYQHMGSNRVLAFESGGLASGVYRAGKPIYKFAEQNTKFETFLSGKAGQEVRNIGLAYKTIGMLERQLGRPVTAPAGFGGGSGSVDARQYQYTIPVVPNPRRPIHEQVAEAERLIRARTRGR